MKQGDKLANGGIVLLHRVDGECSPAWGHIVLAVYESKFVTWRMNKFGDTFWGNYFDSPDTVQALIDAIEDFKTR